MEFSNNVTIKNQTIKNNSIINKIFDDDYLKSLRYVLSVIIRRNDVENAFSLLKVLTEAVTTNKAKLAAYPEIDNYYKEVLISLKFIAFPLLDNEENIDLVKNHFTWQFNMPDYDIREKLSGKLLNILILEDRDKFKADLRAALLNNQENITKQAETKSISDWLKNYNANLGIGVTDILKRTQYFVDLTKVKGLDERLINRLKSLFNFYELLKMSSVTQAGFDEEPPIMIDGNLYIFNHGVLDLITKVKETFKKSSVVSEAPIKVEENKTVSVSAAGSELEFLKKLAVKYQPGSLEKKVIEEEIKRREAEVRVAK